MNHYKKFIKDRESAYFRVMCDLAFLKEHNASLLSREEDFRDTLVGLNKKMDVLKKEKAPNPENLQILNKDINEINLKLNKVNSVRDKIKQFTEVRSELEYYLLKLYNWQEKKRFIYRPIKSQIEEKLGEKLNPYKH